MKFALAYLGSWALYWLGHVACLILESNDDSEAWVSIWYPVYNSLMIASSMAQDWYGESKHFPWQATAHHEEL